MLLTIASRLEKSGQLLSTYCPSAQQGALENGV